MNFKSVIASFLISTLIACGGTNPVSETTPLDSSVRNLPNQNYHVSIDVEKLRSNTLILSVKKDDSYITYCSGVWISETRALTAHHCVEQGVINGLDAEEIEAIVRGDQEEPKLEGRSIFYRTHADYQRDHEAMVSQRARMIKIVAVEKPTDLALLEVIGTAPPHGLAKLRKDKVVDGSFVWALGHSAGMHYTVSYGVVSASRRDGDLTLLQVSVPVSGGNSGGGVYDTNGQLIGIVSGMFRNANQITFATHQDSIKDFLDANGGTK